MAWGESCQFSAHLDVSEVSRLGPLGGTTGHAGVDERSAVDHGEDTAATESRRRAASTLIDSHDAVFRRTARRYSICADDAEDAYQRALEILLTKAPPIEGDALVRWMQTVTKREALAVRRQRERLLGSPRAPGHGDDADRDPLEFIASESPGPNDRLARRERVARSGEALRALKPQEVRALTLKAQGYSYAEIGEITGWSYTKINRCMAEGRKRFLQVFSDIEQGRRCEQLAGALSELADGEGANGSTDAVEFHLRSCATCRAKLRAYRAVPGRVFDLPLPDRCSIRRSAGAPTSGSSSGLRPPWTRFARRAIHFSLVAAEGAAARRPRWPRPAGPAERGWRRSRRFSQSAERLRPGGATCVATGTGGSRGGGRERAFKSKSSATPAGAARKSGDVAGCGENAGRTTAASDARPFQ